MFLQVIDSAGWPIWLLIFTSIAALSIIIERAFFLRLQSIIPKDLVIAAETMIDKNNINREELIQLCHGNFLGKIYSVILKNPDHTPKEIRAELEQIAVNVRYRLEMHLSYLSTIATIAPLLGLFGTIIGMVELFGSFTSGGSDVSAFANGISIALYNTAGGILVAVPVMVAYRFYKTMVNHRLNELELHANLLIAEIYK